MKKNNIVAVCAIVLAVLVLFSGCAAALQILESAEIRQRTETMLDALIADDPQTAYLLVSTICTQAEFLPTFRQMQTFLGDVDAYELKLLSIHKNSAISNGHKSSLVSSVYEMTTKHGKIIVNVSMDGQHNLQSFYLTPYEKTNYYATGTLENMKGATGAQWIFLLLNVIALGFAAFALVDCCLQTIKRKALWILLLIMGFATIGATISSTGFRLIFNVRWITAYSAFIRYGSGAVMFRLMLPVGAIIYFVKRRSLLKQSAPAAAPCEEGPENPKEESSTDQQPSQTPTDDQA